jgi:uncharacterized protein
MRFFSTVFAMNRIWLLLLSLALAIGAGGCGRSTAVDNAPLQVDPIYGHLLHAQPKLPTVKVKLGNEELIAEIARKPLEIATGMMYRTNMAENEAMLFVFPNAGRRSFYMRNCVVPLSAAYMSPDGAILQTIDMQPRNERGIPSDSDNVQFVIEVPQGWFERHDIGTGMVVRTERGSLLDTFFPK